jgi:hypothetical protein
MANKAADLYSDNDALKAQLAEATANVQMGNDADLAKKNEQLTSNNLLPEYPDSNDEFTHTTTKKQSRFAICPHCFGGHFHKPGYLETHIPARKAWAEAERSGTPPDSDVAVYPNEGAQFMDERQMEVAIETMKDYGAEEG